MVKITGKQLGVSLDGLIAKLPLLEGQSLEFFQHIAFYDVYIHSEEARVYNIDDPKEWNCYNMFRKLLATVNRTTAHMRKWWNPIGRNLLTAVTEAFDNYIEQIQTPDGVVKDRSRVVMHRILWISRTALDCGAMCRKDYLEILQWTAQLDAMWTCCLPIPASKPSVPSTLV